MRINFSIWIIFFFITVQEDNSGVVVVPELQVFSSLLYTLLLRLQVVSICSRDMIHNTKIGWSQRKLFMKLRHGKKSLLDYYNTYWERSSCCFWCYKQDWKNLINLKIQLDMQRRHFYNFILVYGVMVTGHFI